MSVVAVLFDLDGTLIDSAPDLAGAANDMRTSRGMARLDLAALRPMVGTGARGMLGVALNVAPGEPEFESLRDEFLMRYESRMLQETQLFDGVAPVLDRLDAAQVRWGIVTNKITRFAGPISEALGLRQRAGTLVCGDTTGFSKPHPAPLLEAARRIQVAPDACIYIGDDSRDIEAGRAAGMRTGAAGWGYLGNGARIETWAADVVLNVPAEVLKLLELA